MEKDIILDFGNVIVKREDASILVIEKEFERFNEEKEVVKYWEEMGCTLNIQKAVDFIIQRDLLINEEQVKDLESYLDEIEKAKETVMNALGGNKK